MEPSPLKGERAAGRAEAEGEASDRKQGELKPQARRAIESRVS